MTNVTVNCTTNTFLIGGTVTGLNGTGLALRNNGGNDLAVTANGAFTFSASVRQRVRLGDTVKRLAGTNVGLAVLGPVP